MRAPRTVKIDGEIVFDLPDCADQPGAGVESADIQFVEEFADRPRSRENSGTPSPVPCAVRPTIALLLQIDTISVRRENPRRNPHESSCERSRSERNRQNPGGQNLDGRSRDG